MRCITLDRLRRSVFTHAIFLDYAATSKPSHITNFATLCHTQWYGRLALFVSTALARRARCLEEERRERCSRMVSSRQRPLNPFADRAFTTFARRSASTSAVNAFYRCIPTATIALPIGAAFTLAVGKQVQCVTNF
jgi:hypothetical protein